MAPRRTNAEPANEWEELRRTLVTMHENIQVTIQNSFREFAEAVHHCERDHNRRRQPSEDGSTEVEDNPFA